MIHHSSFIIHDHTSYVIIVIIIPQLASAPFIILTIYIYIYIYLFFLFFLHLYILWAQTSWVLRTHGPCWRPDTASPPSLDPGSQNDFSAKNKVIFSRQIILHIFQTKNHISESNKYFSLKRTYYRTGKSYLRSK